MATSQLFDGYLVVDWSANSTPKQGKDSIWWCHLAWNNDTLEIVEIRNRATLYNASIGVLPCSTGSTSPAARINGQCDC